MKWLVIPLFCILYLPTSFSAVEFNGLVQLTGTSNNSSKSYQDSGTGILRTSGNTLSLNQAILSTEADFLSSWNIKGVANAYSDGESHFGISQLFATYKPLTANKYKFESKIGFFYPELSVENTDIGWLSEDFITNSAINSWIGEELRIIGGEIAIKRPGRAARSPWSFEANAAVYKGNDTLGTHLTWRGFAVHDRQTLYGERVNFAAYPSVVSEDSINGPNWNEPFKELDGRWGAYVGLKAQYLRKLDIRYYFYDNFANPERVDSDHLYGWRTRFHSLAMRYFLSRNTKILAQFMSGSTLMGPNVVRANYYSGFAAISHTFNAHKISLRADWFKVVETDNYEIDANDSDGKTLTINWQYSLNPSTTLVSELLWLSTYAQSRIGYWQRPDETILQSQIGITYRF